MVMSYTKTTRIRRTVQIPETDVRKMIVDWLRMNEDGFDKAKPEDVQFNEMYDGSNASCIVSAEEESAIGT